MTVSQPLNVFNISAEIPFIEALAKGILLRADDSPFGLADFMILLPTRRAIRSLRDAFVRQNRGAPMLLPRMLPLGDLDEEELLINGWEGSGIKFGGEIEFGLPDAISNIQRQLMLTKRIMFLKGRDINIEQAAQLAGELGRLLDQVHIEQLEFDNLSTLVPDEYAQHWQVTIEFLEIITKFWPSLLEEKGLMDAAQRRNFIMQAQLSHWRREAPDFPIIAAGSTGSIPMTADLLKLIAGLPQGVVILPGLDQTLNFEDIKDIEAHPQYGLLQLLNKMGLASGQVEQWPYEKSEKSSQSIQKFVPTPRIQIISHFMCPTKRVNDWRSLDFDPREALQGVENITCSSPDEEAGVIALKLRQVLETPKKTAALITPDRRLARRVSVELRRWGIIIDDSAGIPLRQTVLGSFLRLTAKLVSDNFLPIDLLSIGKHPLSAGLRKPVAFRQLIRKLEVEYLRGPRPTPGIKGLLALLPLGDSPLKKMLEFIQSTSNEFREAITKKKVSLADILRAHLVFSESLASTQDELGSNRLWSGEDGEATSKFISSLLEVSDSLDNIAGLSYSALFDVLLNGQVARSNSGSHPRLAIWGLLEARLQYADVIILSGLNEGTWPPDAGSDPWMSRPMRKEFGLPSPERRIGLTAHDFQQALSAKEVVLTRSARVDGTPTVPSRWLVRLQKLLTAMEPDYANLFFQSNCWLYWQSCIDQPKKVKPIKPPSPCPPIEVRPRKLSVTQIETWMRDPYAIYSRYILRLKALPKLDVSPDVSDYGTLIHDVMDRFSKKYKDDLPVEPLDALIKIGEKEFESILKYPSVWAFWWPRFLRIAKWFVDLEIKRRKEIKETHSEVRGVVEIITSKGEFQLTAKADRIDELKDGTLRIIDYKTGAPPSKAEVAAGFSPQLPLEALIVQAGGFEGISAKSVSDLSYWRLRGGNPAGEILSVGENPIKLIVEAEKGVAALIRRFDDESTPYESQPRPENAPKFSDYEHLARVKEWSTYDRESGS